MPTAVCACPRQLCCALSVGWPAAARNNEVACCLETMARFRSDEQPRSPLLATSAPWLPKATSHVIPRDTYTRRRAPPNMPTTYPALHRDFLSRRCCATLLLTPGKDRRPALWSRCAALLSCLFAANWRRLAGPMLAKTFAAVRAQRPRLTKTHGAHARDACLRETGQHLPQCRTTISF